MVIHVIDTQFIFYLIEHLDFFELRVEFLQSWLLSKELIDFFNGELHNTLSSWG